MRTATAGRPKALVPDLVRFGEIKGRVSDLYNYSNDLIRSNKTCTVWAGIFPEMAWLVAETKRLGGVKALEPADATRFHKTEKFVARVCEEQAEAIAGGQFVKIAASIFSAFRFLVRMLQATIVDLVDDETALRLLDEELPEEHVERIQLDLSEGIVDDEPAVADEKVE